MGRGLHRARWVLWLTGLLVPAEILGQQEASLPPPPVTAYMDNSPSTPAPARLPELASQPLPPPGQGAEVPPATATTPAVPPTTVPSPASPAGPPVTAAPALEPLPEVQPIATTDAGNDRPALGPIQQAAFMEKDAPPPSPTPKPDSTSAAQGVLRESGLPFESPALGTPASPSPSTEKEKEPRPSRAPGTGLIMEPEPKTGGERPAPGVAGSPAAGPGASLLLQTSTPARIVIGKPVQQRILVRNVGTADAVGVRIEEGLPAGVRPLHSEPEAAVVGGRLTWDLGTVEAGSERSVQVQLEAGEPMTLDLSPTLHFLGGQTHIVQPELTLTLEGPERVMRGEPVLFRLVVSNNSPQPLHQVQLHYEVPEGLEHPHGKRIGLTLQTPLQPGEKRNINLELASVKAGKWSNRIAALGDNGIRAEVQHEVVVVEPLLTLHIKGPTQALTEQEIVFRIEAGNPGPTPATHTRVVLLIPAGVQPVATQPAAHYDALHRSLSWTLDELPVKKQGVMLLKVRGLRAGDWPLYAHVSAANRSWTRCGHTLRVETPPPLAVEIVGGKEAIDMGEETVYEVHVLNMSRQTLNNVRLTAQLTPTLAAGRVSGPVHGAGEQQQARFDLLPHLEPSRLARYQIPVRGQRPGPGGLHLEVSADGLQTAISREARTVVTSRPVRVNEAGAAR